MVKFDSHPPSNQEKRMRTLIHKPLCALRDLLTGPRNLIRKRLDKLLDYEVLEAKSNLSYEEQDVVNTYRWREEHHSLSVCCFCWFGLKFESFKW